MTQVRILGALLGSLLLAGTTLGQGYNGYNQHNYSYYPGYNYYQGYTCPCSPPGYYGGHQNYGYNQQYQHQNSYLAQKVIGQDVNVYPLIVTVPVESKAVPANAYGSPYYYSASDTYREKAYLRELLREELQKLTGQPAQGQATQVQPAPVEQRAAVVPQAPEPGQLPQAMTTRQAPSKEKKVWAEDTVTPVQLRDTLLAAFQGRSNCVNCHGAEGPARGEKGEEFRLIVNVGGKTKLAKQTSDKRWKIYAMAASFTMPPKANEDGSKTMETKYLPALMAYAAQKE